MKVKKETLSHPIFVFVALIISTIIATLGSTTFATMSYVDNKYKESKKYTQEKHRFIRDDMKNKHKDYKDDIKEIKKAIQNINNNILTITN